MLKYLRNESSTASQQGEKDSSFNYVPWSACFWSRDLSKGGKFIGFFCRISASHSSLHFLLLGVGDRLLRSRDWSVLSIYTFRQFRSMSLACGVYLGVKTCEVFLCFVASVRVRVYYADFFVFFLLRHWWVSQAFTPRMNPPATLHLLSFEPVTFFILHEYNPPPLLFLICTFIESWVELD